MTLLLPAWLAVAGLVLVVLALHRRKRNRVEVASVLLWRRLQEFAAPQRSLKRPPITLLLILQLLIVLLAALALARPLLGAPPAPHHRVYLLDASDSMRATDERPDRFAEALAFISREAETLPDGNRMSVVLVGSNPAIVVARQDRGSGIVPILDRLAAEDAHADWTAAAALLPSIIRDGEETDIVTVTDGADAAAELVSYGVVPVTHHVVASGAPANLGLSATAAAIEGRPGFWRFEGRIAGDPAGPVTLAVRFAATGASSFIDWTEVEIAAGSAGAFAFELELPRAGAVEIALPDDAAPADDAVFFVVAPEPRMVRVLRVGPDDPAVDAAVAGIDGVALVTAATLPSDASDYDLVIVDGIAVPRRPATNVLWLGAGHPEAGDEPVPAGAAEASRWRDDHPLSRDIDWGDFLPEAAFIVPDLPGAEVIVESGRAALLQSRMTATGREMWLAAELAGDAWAGTPAFPLFFRNVVDWLGITPGPTAPSCIVGEPCAVEARFAGSPMVALADGASVSPDGNFVPSRAGIYAVGDGAAFVAVNAGRETALAPLFATNAERIVAGSWTRELWWWLLAAVLVLLFVEGFLAGRGAERFLQAPALANTNPLAGRYRTLLFLRVVAIILTVLAVVNVPLPARERAEDIVVVASGRTIGALALDPLEASFGARIGLVALDAPARIAGDLAGGALFPASAGTPAGTDLEGALRLAAAMLPGDRTGRIVLAAGGPETAGDAADVVSVLVDRSIAVDAAVQDAMPPGEVLVAELRVPATVHAGDTFPLRAAIVAAGPTAATVTIFRDGTPVVSQEVALVAGSNRVEAHISDVPAGRSTFEVAVAAPGDTVEANNRSTAIVDAGVAPRIAIITPDSSWGFYFADALAIQGLAADVLLPRDAPWELEGWLEYDLVVTMNLPALALDTVQQDLLEVAVRDHGTGLFLLGGENSFGPGGYYQTAFERMSPLSSRTPRDAPASAIVFVLDRSGSMQAAAPGGTRLDIAKVATNHAISLLEDNTEVGVIAFDSAAHVIAPLRPRSESLDVADAIGAMVAGGGTAMFPALEEAIAQLSQSEAAIRHIVLMTDGLAEPADFYPILQRARTANLTISTVAIGQGADAALLRQIANIGGGAFSATEDFSALPAILAREALLLAGSPVRNRSTPVDWSDRDAAFLAGIGDLPPVRSFVVTTAQPRADVHLTVTDEEDGALVPLLASWRYGAGRVLALATHGAGAGTRDWIGLPDYPRMWGQFVRHFLPDAEGEGMHLALARSGDVIRVEADLVGPAGEAVAGRSLVGTVDGPSGVADFALRESADGRYEGEFRAAGTGTYTVTVAGDDAAATSAVVVPYPAIFDFSRAEPERIAAIVSATGGDAYVRGAELFTASPVWSSRSGWWLWAALALAVFMLDLVIRHAPRLLGLVGGRRAPAGTNRAGYVPSPIWPAHREEPHA